MVEPREPHLDGLSEFEAWAADKQLKVRRIYEWPAEGDEVGYWQVFLVREELRFDGKLYAFVLEVDDLTISRRWTEGWESMAELHASGWERTLQENLVSAEDERIFEIAGTIADEEFPSPDDITFLLDVISVLKARDLQMAEAMREEWRLSNELRRELEPLQAQIGIASVALGRIADETAPPTQTARDALLAMREEANER